MHSLATPPSPPPIIAALSLFLFKFRPAPTNVELYKCSSVEATCISPSINNDLPNCSNSKISICWPTFDLKSSSTSLTTYDFCKPGELYMSWYKDLVSLLNSFLTILLCLNSFLIISIATDGLTFPHVKKSKLIIPFSGNVWKLIWLSANKAKIVNPCGSNLYFEMFRIVTSAAFAISLITFSYRDGSYSLVVPIISRVICSPTFVILLCDETLLIKFFTSFKQKTIIILRRGWNCEKRLVKFRS